MSEFEPGTVAMAHPPSGPDFLVIRNRGGVGGGGYWSAPLDWPYGVDPEECEIRPLVVLDLSDWEPVAVKAALRYCARSADAPMLAEIADQIEAQTRPPKPAEPTGLGAVVEDAEGWRWVYTGDRDHLGTWWLCADDPSRYADIDAVRVLSEGVSDA